MFTRWRIFSILIVHAAVILIAPQASGQALIPCAPDSAGIATRALDGLKELAIGQTSGDSVWRGSLKLPVTDSSLVTMVHDPAVCDAAARAWARQISPTAPADSVWVIAFGPDRYFVFDERRPTVGTLLIGVFDRSLVWLEDVLM